MRVCANLEEIKMSLFNGKTLLITGGTGSFGNAVLNRFLKTDIGEIRVFSRDEKKQDIGYELCFAHAGHDAVCQLAVAGRKPEPVGICAGLSIVPAGEGRVLHH